VPQLTRKEVEEIAMLARLHLETDEVMRMQDELGKILDHFLALATVDTDGIPAMTHAVPMDLRLRADEAAPSLPASDALKAAPARDGDLFLVPAIITGGEK
jgi:aspartyl-tRNA(Asn)/glutamyl-tRNA(Gln) amidotransferase subunit C